MAINNMADLEQQILRLEQDEQFKRKQLTSFIITPSAALHTFASLFMTWVKAGRDHKAGGDHFSLLKILGLIISPIELLKRTIGIFKTMGISFLQILSKYFNLSK